MRPQETRKQYKEMQKGARPVVHRFPCLSSALIIPVILLMNGVLKTVVTGRLLPSHIETRGSPAPRSTPSSGSGGLRKGLELAEAGAEEAVQDESVRRTDCCSASSRVVLSTPSHVLDTLSAEEEMRATSCSIKMTTSTHSIASRGEERFASQFSDYTQVTHHAPGQLVAYPILNLNYYVKDLHAYLRLVVLSLFDIMNSSSSPSSTVLPNSTLRVRESRGKRASM